MEIIKEKHGWCKRIICKNSANNIGCYSELEIIEDDLFKDTYTISNVCGHGTAIYCCCPVCGNKIVICTSLQRMYLEKVFKKVPTKEEWEALQNFSS